MNIGDLDNADIAVSIGAIDAVCAIDAVGAGHFHILGLLEVIRAAPAHGKHADDQRLAALKRG